jgi:hypothetical protein
VFDLNDAMYGLRNLVIGDDEQTRIGDVDPSEFHEAVQDSIAYMLEGPPRNYVAAYYIAIWSVVRDMTEEQVDEAIKAWVDEWLEEEPLEADAELATCMKGEYKTIVETFRQN